MQQKFGFKDTCSRSRFNDFVSSRIINAARESGFRARTWLGCDIHSIRIIYGWVNI